MFAGFSCGNIDLDEFFQQDAEPHQQSLIARIYSFHLKEEGAVSLPVACVSLANDTIRLSNRKKNRLFPQGLRYRAYPAVKIGRLGTNQDFHRMGIGSYLIWALKMLFLTDNRTGCRFITVDAYNKSAVTEFYEKNDFEFLTEDDKKEKTRSMYSDF